MLSPIFVLTKAGRLMLVMLAALLLAGCPSSKQVSTTNIQGKANAKADHYLQQLQQSNHDNKAEWQLLAIRALTREGRLPEATALLNTLPQGMKSAQLSESQLLAVELQTANSNYSEARALLHNIDSRLLSPNQLLRLYQLQITSSEGQVSLPLIRAYIAQEPLISSVLHQDNIDQTWQILLKLKPADMNSLVINADENVLQGWLDLFRVYQENKQNAEQLKTSINDWKNRYPQNPAAITLPTALNQILNFTQTSTSNIALLLPLNGPGKVFADAIQQGFEAAKNGVTAVATSQMPQPMTPLLAKNAQLKVYDTSSQPLAALLAQAQQEGATLVVGPLLKTNVEQLATIPTTLSVLALNQLEQPQDSQNICYFALSPEDETRDAARHIWEQQKRQPLLLLPQGTFGDRIAKNFADEWQQLGGQTVLQQSIGSGGELRQMVNSGGIRMTGTPIAAVQSPSQSVTIAGLTIPTQPSDIQTPAEGNVDAVYIVATQEQLALLKPMIDISNGSRNKPAIFASSRSYQGGAGSDFRLEMEGLQFSDIPLLAGKNPELQQQASAKFGNDYSLMRLYAMGIDAWALANHFAELRQLPGFQVSGITGVLTSSPQCVISRKLTWLQYRQGVVVPVS